MDSVSFDAIVSHASLEYDANIFPVNIIFFPVNNQHPEMYHVLGYLFFLMAKNTIWEFEYI